jgi:hypothetical protein
MQTDANENEPQKNTRPKQRRSYSRHGLNALMARVKIRGLNAIDKRTAAAQALIAWRGELIADLGGPEACSAAKLALVELAVRTRLYVDSLDAWLLAQRSLIQAKKRAVLPVVLQRQQLADALARYLVQLGLERRAKPALTALEIMSGYEKQEEQP